MRRIQHVARSFFYCFPAGLLCLSFRQYNPLENASVRSGLQADRQGRKEITRDCFCLIGCQKKIPLFCNRSTNKIPLRGRKTLKPENLLRCDKRGLESSVRGTGTRFCCIIFGLWWLIVWGVQGEDPLYKSASSRLGTHMGPAKISRTFFSQSPGGRGPFTGFAAIHVPSLPEFLVGARGLLQTLFLLGAFPLSVGYLVVLWCRRLAGRKKSECPCKLRGIMGPCLLTLETHSYTEAVRKIAKISPVSQWPPTLALIEKSTDTGKRVIS